MVGGRDQSCSRTPFEDVANAVAKTFRGLPAHGGYLRKRLFLFSKQKINTTGILYGHRSIVLH